MLLATKHLYDGIQGTKGYSPLVAGLSGFCFLKVLRR